MCGCNSNTVTAERERVFGRLMGNYGFGPQYANANQPLLDHNTYLFYQAHPMPGNIGYRYGTALSSPQPLDYDRGYRGILPLSQQPHIDMPQPYVSRYVG